MRYIFEFGFIKALFNRFFDDEIGVTAAALSYYMIFSFFPLLIMMSIFLGRFTMNSQWAEMLLNSILPADVLEMAGKYIEFVNSEGSRNILFASVFFTVYFPMRSVGKLIDGISKAYNKGFKPNAFKKYISVFIFGIAVYVMIVFAMIMISFGESAAAFLFSLFDLPKESARIWNSVKFLILWCVGIFLVLALHYAASSGDIRVRHMLPGCVASVTVWTIVSGLFSMYVKYIGRYSVLYGSIGAVIILLYWLYITAVILLMGAEFSSLLRERLKS